jgi:CxxC motif-containing protein (DUF1111 family)
MSLTRTAAVLGSLLLASAVGAQFSDQPLFKRAKLPRPPDTAASTAAAAGQALQGLDPASAAAFSAGQAEFTNVEVEGPGGALGPIFNDTSCAACHTAGGIGCGSDRWVTRFAQVAGGRFDALEAMGGSLLQARSVRGVPRETVPAQANVVVERITTPVFGAGLIEAIPDEDIVRNGQRRQPDGVQGKVAHVLDPASGQWRVGRFGWKAQQASLLAFSGDAYLNEMGVTNRLFPTENAPNGNTRAIQSFLNRGVEDAVDPATGLADIDLAANFMRLLAPPPPGRATASSLAGGRVFEQIGCAACHTPTLFTGPHKVAALSNQPVPLYSDLLLHDMGRLGDGIAQAAAGPREMRTAPLWGLRLRPSYLHDGRASTVSQAIVAHDGEAAAASRRFSALKGAEQQQLLDFLRSL